VIATPPPNKRLQRNGIKVPLIENLPLAQLPPGCRAALGVFALGKVLWKSKC